MATLTSNITTKLNKEISNIVKRSNFDRKFMSTTKDITYSDFLSNKMLMIFIIRQGVPYSFFNLIQHLTPFTEDNWADFQIFLQSHFTDINNYQRDLNLFNQKK